MRRGQVVTVAVALLGLSWDASRCCGLRESNLWEMLERAEALVIGAEVARDVRQTVVERQVVEAVVDGDEEGSPAIPRIETVRETVNVLQVTIKLDEVVRGSNQTLQPGALLLQQYNSRAPEEPLDVRHTFSASTAEGRVFLYPLDQWCDSASCRERFGAFVRRAAKLLESPEVSLRAVADWSLSLAADDDLWSAGLVTLATQAKVTALPSTGIDGEQKVHVERLFELLTEKEIAHLVELALEAGPHSERFLATINLPFERVPAELLAAARHEVETILQIGGDLAHAQALIERLVFMHADSYQKALEEAYQPEDGPVARSARTLWLRINDLQVDEGKNLPLLRHAWASLIQEGWIPDGRYDIAWWQPDLAAAAFEHFDLLDWEWSVDPDGVDDGDSAERPPDEWESRWSAKSAGKGEAEQSIEIDK